MKWLDRFNSLTKKNSQAKLRLGSWVGVVAILVGAGALGLGERLGTPDALWIKIAEWGAVAVFAGDIARSLLKLSPRKRWETILICSLSIGGGLLVGSVVLCIEGEAEWSKVLVMGLLILLIFGGLGFVMWRHELRRLNSLILERKLQRKKRWNQ